MGLSMRRMRQAQGVVWLSFQLEYLFEYWKNELIKRNSEFDRKCDIPRNLVQIDIYLQILPILLYAFPNVFADVTRTRSTIITMDHSELCVEDGLAVPSLSNRPPSVMSYSGHRRYSIEVW